MPPAKKPPARKAVVRPSLAERTPVAEWTAAALGLLVTLAVLGYSLWEGLSQADGPPALQVQAESPVAQAGVFVVPVTVRNDGPATAAAVEIKGVLTLPQGGEEERRASFTYVPGGGEVKGGLVFQADPRGRPLELSVEGYEEP